VRPEDAVESAGDEALWLARALDPRGVPVFLGEPRQSAIELAAAAASIVIVDGLLQARPRRLSLSLLALDGLAPWGAQRCPPAGDLRALRSRLLSACDAVLLANDPVLAQGNAPTSDLQLHGKTVMSWSSELTGAWTPEGRFVNVSELARLRLGLLLAVARPERIQSALAARGIGTGEVVLYGDHTAPRPPPGRGLDAWLTTAKCATKVRQIAAAAPVWTLEHRALLPSELTGRLAQFAPEKPVVWCAP
jgi:tetraacyldisaccharide-1-P 4'-kinase